MQQSRSHNLLEDIALRGATWALVGTIFGTLFVVLVEMLQGHVPVAVALLAGTVVSSALTSLFYGSMRLTVMVANFTFIATLIYTWQGAPHLGLEPLVFVGAGVGLAVGTAYGLHDSKSRVFCADAKIVAGAFAGSLGGAAAVLLSLLLDDLSYRWLAMLVAPLVVLIYVMSARWFVQRCHRLLPAAGDGAVVGLGVGTVTGLVFLIMAGTLDPALLGAASMQGFVERVESAWAATVLGCAVACFAVGVARSVLKVPWYNL